MARFWYAYNGSGDPFSSASYILTSALPICSNGCKICAIYSPGSGNPTNPLSSNLKSYITNSLVRLSPQPESGMQYLLLKPC